MGKRSSHVQSRPTSSYASGRSSSSRSDGARPRITAAMSRSDSGSPSAVMALQNSRVMRPAIPRSDILRPERSVQRSPSTSAVNGFSGKQECLATHPMRELCGTGTKPRTTGMPRSASCSSEYEGHAITLRTMPTMSVAVAAISAASGVKSAVISMRLARGRTPTPVERRLAASSMTGVARMCVSRYASASTERPLVRSSYGMSNDTL